MEYLSAMKSRYSSKRMNGSRVEGAKLDRILGALSLSASSYGLQPYKVLAIQNGGIKQAIQPFCNQQAQIVECDVLLIFCAFLKIEGAYLDSYIERSSEVRKIPLEKLLGYKKVISDKVGVLERDKALYGWASKQAYIALGTVLMACALEGVDACPLEGFDNTKIDDFFGLKSDNMGSSVMVAIGRRDEVNDYNAVLPKYRKPLEELLIWKK